MKFAITYFIYPEKSTGLISLLSKGLSRVPRFKIINCMALCLLYCAVLHLDFPGGSDGKAFVYNVGDLGSIPGLGRSLEKRKATHSSILAWRIPWTV